MNYEYNRDTNWRNMIMTMANLASYAPSTYDLLSRIGLERRRSRTVRAASRAGWIGLGLCVGSGLTMLFAPRRGSEVRERIADQARRAKEYVAPQSEDRGDSRPQPPSNARATSRL
jgi:hypothetical protein